MSKHTPGPWRADLEPSLNAWRIRTIADIRGMPLASVHVVPTDSAPLANARLIAAAPELLAKLQDAVDEIEAWRKKHGPLGAPDTEAVTMLVVRQARAAIAEATGDA